MAAHRLFHGPDHPPEGFLIPKDLVIPPVAGAVTQEIIDVLAIANALRVTLPVTDLADFESHV